MRHKLLGQRSHRITVIWYKSTIMVLTKAIKNFTSSSNTVTVPQQCPSTPSEAPQNASINFRNLNESKHHFQNSYVPTRIMSVNKRQWLSFELEIERNMFKKEKLWQYALRKKLHLSKVPILLEYPRSVFIPFLKASYNKMPLDNGTPLMRFCNIIKHKNE